MYNQDISDRKMQAIAMIAETTKSYQQIMHECRLSWSTVVELYKEMKKAEISMAHRCDKYMPIEQRTDLGKPHELNLDAWHNELSRQARRRGPSVASPSKSRTRAAQNTETIIARYLPSSSGSSK